VADAGFPALPWLQTSGLAGRPWLVLGKGPSFARHAGLDLSRYAVMGLNHVCRERPVDVTLCNDLEVLKEAGDAVLKQGGTLILPWYPHVGFKPQKDRSLDRCLTSDNVDDSVRLCLGRLKNAGRLAYFRSSRSTRLPHPAGAGRDAGKTVVVRYFSAVAAFNLLGAAGARQVDTLGVDGGKEYAPVFQDQQPLRNGQPNFDVQFREIKVSVELYRLKHRRL
jgi:hypothetical protein